MRTAAVWTFSALLAASLAAQQRPRFEVASVKRTESRTLSVAPIPRAFPGGRFNADFTTVAGLIWFAYNVRSDLIVGGPDWAREDTFQINAKAATDAPLDQIRLMVQSLLEDRFKLVTHVESREISDAMLSRVGERVLIEGARRPGPGPIARAGHSGHRRNRADGQFLLHPSFAVQRPERVPRFRRERSDLPALSTALEEQLGVKLELRRGPIEVRVIDSVQEPEEN